MIFQYHNDNVNVHVTLVNCDELNDEILSINENIIINNDNIKLSAKRDHLVRHGALLFDSIYNKSTKPIPGGFNGPRFLTSNIACYCSNIRFRVIESLLKQDYSNILFMDVDAIVKKDLTTLYNIISKNDITIMKEIRGFNSESRTISKQMAPPDMIDWHCGIIGVNNNTLTRRFIELVRERTENDMWNWDADQDQFNITYNDFKDDIRIYNLPKKYKDEGYRSEGYSDDSYIWCGAGEAKYSNKQYITEQNRYENIGCN